MRGVIRPIPLPTLPYLGVCRLSKPPYVKGPFWSVPGYFITLSSAVALHSNDRRTPPTVRDPVALADHGQTSEKKPAEVCEVLLSPETPLLLSRNKGDMPPVRRRRLHDVRVVRDPSRTQQWSTGH